MRQSSDPRGAGTASSSGSASTPASAGRVSLGWPRRIASLAARRGADPQPATKGERTSPTMTVRTAAPTPVRTPIVITRPSRLIGGDGGSDAV